MQKDSSSIIDHKVSNKQDTSFGLYFDELYNGIKNKTKLLKADFPVAA